MDKNHVAFVVMDNVLGRLMQKTSPNGHGAAAGHREPFGGGGHSGHGPVMRGKCFAIPIQCRWDAATATC